MSSKAASKSQPRQHGDDYIPSPDRSKFLSELDALRAKLTTVRAEITKQKAQIEKQKAQGAQSPEEQKLRDSHTQVLGELKSLRESERKIQAEAAKIDDSVKQKVAQLQLLKPKQGPRTLKDLDAQIEKLEQVVERGSLSLVEESKALKEVSHLKGMRLSFNEANKLQVEIDAVRAKSAALRKEFDQAALRAVMGRKAELEKQLDSFKASRKDRKATMDALFNELRSLQSQSREITQSMDAKRADFDAKMAEFNAKLKARKQQRESEEKQEKEQAARTKKIDAANAKLAAAKEPAFQANIDRAQSLLVFFDPSEASNFSESKKIQVADPSADSLNRKKTVKTIPGGAGSAPANAATQAAQLAARGSQHPPSRKSLKQKKSAQQQESGAAAAPKLQFDFAVVDALSSLNIALPTSADQLEDTKAKLREKIAFYEENNARVTKERVDRAEAELQQVLKEIESTTPEAEASPAAASTEADASAPKTAATEGAAENATEDATSSKDALTAAEIAAEKSA